MFTSQSAFTGVVRSIAMPSISAARAAFCSPLPICPVKSYKVVPFSTSLLLLSGNVIVILLN